MGNTIYSKALYHTQAFYTLKSSDMKTGKKDANFATPNGKYKFFTCSEDDYLCDDYAFQGKSILIAGNGNFNVKFYDGLFNAYQRTYVIQNDDIFGNLFYTFSKNTQSLLKSSKGSIIKFMTMDMLTNVQIPLFDNEINEILNTIILKTNIIKNDISRLQTLKETLLPLLINGQLVV